MAMLNYQMVIFSGEYSIQGGASQLKLVYHPEKPQLTKLLNQLGNLGAPTVYPVIYSLYT